VRARLAGIVLAVVAADQITKLVASTSLSARGSIRLLGDVVRFTLVRNPGVAFGLKFGPWAHVPLTIVSAAVVLVLAVILARKGAVGGRAGAALAAVLGGAVGNLVDRLRFGMVVDFIDVGIGTTRWPVFNIADSAVTLGVLYLLWEQVRQPSGSDPN
jgi:signal peptidase II